MTSPRRRPLLRSAVVATVVALAACRPATAGRGGPAAAPGTRAPPGGSTTTAAVETNAVIDHVVDGDTVDVHIDGRTERVRLIGINTPNRGEPHPVARRCAPPPGRRHRETYSPCPRPTVCACSTWARS